MSELYKEKDEKIDTSFKDEKEGLSEGYKKSEAIDLSYLDSPEYEYLKQSGNIGFGEFKDVLSLLDIGNFKMTPKAVKDAMSSEDYDNKAKENKQAVKDAKEKRNQFALANREDIGIGSQLLGGVVEQITNPIAVGADIAVGVATGGAGLVAKVASQLAIDEGQLLFESERYEDRLPTIKEAGFTALAGALPDIAGSLVGGKLRKVKGTELFQSNVKKDSVGDAISTVANDVGGDKVNIKSPLEQVIEYDNFGNHPKATQQAIKTEYGINVDEGVDPYYQGPVSVKDTDFISDVQDPYGIVSNYKRKAMLGDLETKNNVTIGYGEEDVAKFIKIQNDKDSSILSRYTDTSKVFIHPETDVNLNPKKTILQNFTSIQNSDSGIENKVSEGICNTLAYNFREGKKTINLEQPRGVIDTIDADYQTQKLNIQNEYSQKLGVKFKKFISNIGADNNDMAKAWVGGEDSVDFIDFGKNNSCDAFMKSAYKDSENLTELNMRANIFDNKEYKEIVKEYGTSFDKDGDILYDGNLFETLNKATTNDLNSVSGTHRELLEDTLESSNPTEYVKFIATAKMYLNKKKLTLKDTEAFSDFFNSSGEHLDTHIRKNADYINRKAKELGVEDIIDGNYIDSIRVASKNIKMKHKKFVQDTTRIGEVVDKDRLLRKLETYVDVDKQDIDGFNTDIMPFFEDIDGDGAVFKLPEGKSNKEFFSEFVSDLKKVRQLDNWEDKISLKNVDKYFNEGKMSKFFINVNNGEHLKANWQIVNDIVNKNSTQSARFLQFGSTSPASLQNKMDINLENIIAKEMEKRGSEWNKTDYNTIKQELDRYIDSTHLSANKVTPTVLEKASKLTRTVTAVGTMGATGINELGGNVAFAMYKAQKYGSFSPYFNALRASNRGDLVFPKGKYIVAQMRKDTDFSQFGESDLDKVSRVSLQFQQMSDNQLQNLGEAHTVAQLDHLPKKFDKIDNELKEVLKNNGITGKVVSKKGEKVVTDYDVLKEFARKHIREGEYTVDTDKLSRNVEIGKDREVSKQLLNTYYQMSQYMGDTKYHEKFLPKNKDEMLKWYTMFRSYTRYLNSDLFNRAVNYVSADGITKSKLSKGFIKEVGFSGISKQIGLGVTGAGMLLFMNQSSNIGKELLHSSHTLDQRVAIAHAKVDHIVTAFRELDVKEIPELLGLSIEDILEPTDIIVSKFKGLTHVFDTLTDEQKKAYGTNRTDALKEFLLFASSTIARVITNQGKAIYKYNTQGDIISTPKKIYGLSKEETQKVFADVTQEQIREAMVSEQKYAHSTSDFLNDSNESYDEIDANDYYKQELEKQIADKTEDKKNNFRQMFTVLYSDGSRRNIEVCRRMSYETNNEINLVPSPKDEPKPKKVKKVVDKDGWKAPEKLDINKMFDKKPKIKKVDTDWKAPKKIDLNDFNMKINIKQKKVEDIIKG